MTSARVRKKRQARKGPSAPRAIQAEVSAVVIRGVTLTINQARRLACAEADQASGDLDRRKAGGEAMAVLTAEIDAALAESRRLADENEIVELELRRGSTIETSPRAEHNGRKRITSRDGLETLRTAQAITAIQHAAGLRFRNDYEAIDPEKGLTPPSIDQTRSISRGGEGYAQKRREIEERVFAIHCRIAGVQPPRDGSRAAMPSLPPGHPSMRAIYALNHIAGRGDNLGDLTSSGSVKARMRQDLIVALDVCAKVYGL